MKYLPLIWSGLWRRPVGTRLTFLSISFAFLLVGALYGFNVDVQGIISHIDGRRMRVMSATGSPADHLPLAYLPQIQGVPHVVAAVPGVFFGSYYQEPTNLVTAIALGGNFHFGTTGDLVVPKEQAEEFDRDRRGAIVDIRFAKKYGWHLGQRVSLISTMWLNRDGNRNWEFDIVGFYTAPAESDGHDMFLFKYDYLDEYRAMWKGTVSYFLLRTDNPKHNAAVAEHIDQLFANSACPTLTQSDLEWSIALVEEAKNLRLIVNAISGAALFTLLFLTGNTTMESVRQRIPEFAVLKTIGFSDSQVATLVMAESAALYVFGAVVGLAVVTALSGSRTVTFNSSDISMPPAVVVGGVAVAILAAFISAAAPAIRARRLSVVSGLRYRR